jgi:hypothetical protein
MTRGTDQSPPRGGFAGESANFSSRRCCRILVGLDEVMPVTPRSYAARYPLDESVKEHERTDTMPGAFRAEGGRMLRQESS